ncbi:MAG TPA: hypothetical protein VNQ77_19195 [Frankiaceae bacterium]|nr:hypothetical protein [Frankiaceae bacterium]
MTAEPSSALTDGMRDQIESYRAGGMSLNALAWELKSRIATLSQTADPEWVDELKSTWNQLEYINAIWIESGRESLTLSEQNDIDEILGEFCAMLTPY